MLMLVTYDVNVTTRAGERRLRHIAKVCLDHGVRVQNSVFECEVDPAQWVQFKAELLRIYDPNQDSLRFYSLGKRGVEKVEHCGAKPTFNPLHSTLIL
ncbi:CRISPR-associated endonuclease Cas2 [Limnohabitans sp. Rim28]|uniref:CRISPR-associated endonuclease Cas2 n=1 Tax=Limnohabitans sp. Rim28 TaxID=1100720 RepID=UPI0002EE136F|nr:CRISPR-associated endonuclease Cas2 [Limnohabitans sp. Rim28]PVE07741.1 CRISPR-associated endonuclease Cas2 [Limnohabitans sp. Rim28]